MHNDEFEPLNALGAHSAAYKIGNFYVKIPCLPEYLQYRIHYIFLGLMYFANDRKEYGNDQLFTPLIQELNKLEQLEIKVNHIIYKRVKFITVLLLGNNLGLNGVLRFTECFIANYYCRFCKSSKNEM